jgi:hypothetical protein
LTEHVPDHWHPVVVTTWPDATATAGADFTTNPGSIDAGSYTDTWTWNYTREVLKEGGAQHRLWHVWRFTDLPAGTSHTLYVRGYRPDNLDDDDFKVLYKWSTTCTGLFQQTGLTINMPSGDEQLLSTTFGTGSSSGSLCVAIDDSADGSNDDTVHIDQLYVLTTCPEQ